MSAPFEDSTEALFARYGGKTGGGKPPKDGDDPAKANGANGAKGTRKKRREQLRLVPPSQMKWEGAQLNLVKGLLGHAMFALFYGASGSAKSLIALSLALHVALGRPWCGRKVKQGLVVYIAPEGGHSIHLRFHAWCKYHGIDSEDDRLLFRTIPARLDLCHSAEDLEAIIANIEQAEAELNAKCVLIIVDTVSRALAGGDENSPSDMGAYVVNCDYLRERIRATILGVHHTPADKKEPRGHTAHKNAMDTRAFAEKISDDLFSLTIGHLKDSAAGGVLFFARKTEIVGTNEEGEPVEGSLVVPTEMRTASEQTRPEKGRLTERQALVMKQLRKEAQLRKSWTFTYAEFAVAVLKSGAVEKGEDEDGRKSRRLRDQLAVKGLVRADGQAETVLLIESGLFDTRGASI